MVIPCFQKEFFENSGANLTFQKHNYFSLKRLIYNLIYKWIFNNFLFSVYDKISLLSPCV